MKKITMLLAAACAATTISSPAVAQVGIYSKCRTVNGNIIVVQGATCPAGTVWVGRG